MAIITSIQRGTIAHTGVSNTATISSVDTSKSIVLLNGWIDPNTLSTDIEENMVRLDLQDATTVRCRRDTDGGFSPTVYYSVIEFDEIIDSVQVIEITLTTALSGTATISSVDTTRAAVLYQGLENTESSSQWTQALARLTLTDPTTVTANRASTTETITINGVVVEFTAASINNIQQKTSTLSAGFTDQNQSVTSVDMSNTILFDGGLEFTGSTIDNFPDAHTLTKLTSSTNINIARGDNEGQIETNYTLIEFVDGVIESMSRGSVYYTSASTTVATGNTVDLNFTVPIYTGIWASTEVNHDETALGCYLPNTTQITLLRDDAGNDVYQGVEVWEFVDGTLGGGGVSPEH